MMLVGFYMENLASALVALGLFATIFWLLLLLPGGYRDEGPPTTMPESRLWLQWEGISLFK